jgi:hypothetical protein
MKRLLSFILLFVSSYSLAVETDQSRCVSQVEANALREATAFTSTKGQVAKSVSFELVFPENQKELEALNQTILIVADLYVADPKDLPVKRIQFIVGSSDKPSLFDLPLISTFNPIFTTAGSVLAVLGHSFQRLIFYFPIEFFSKRGKLQLLPKTELNPIAVFETPLTNMSLPGLKKLKIKSPAKNKAPSLEVASRLLGRRPCVPIQTTSAQVSLPSPLPSPRPSP